MKKAYAIALLSGMLLGSLPPSVSAGAETTSPPLVAAYGTSWLVKSDGTFWVWGGFQQQTVPTQVQGLHDAEQAFDGQYVRTKDGSLWHWAQQGGSPGSFKLERIEGIADPVNVIAGYNEGYVLDKEGRVYYGVRDDASSGAFEFSLLEGISDVEEMTVYYNYPNGSLVVFLKNDGSVWRTAFASPSVEQAAEIQDAVRVDAELVYLKNGSVREWKTEYDSSDMPNWRSELSQQVGELPSLKSVESNGSANLGIDGQGRLWFWGKSVTGFSDGTERHEQEAPVRLTGVDSVKAAYAMDRSIVALTEEGKLYEASIEGETMKADAKFVLLAKDVAGLSAGSKSSVLQKSDGSLWAWGLNKYGTLGTGEDKQFTSEAPIPMQAPIEVVLNGESVQLNNGVVTRNGQAFVPLRSIFERLGAKIAWDGTSKIATLERAASEQNAAVSVQLNFLDGTTRLNGTTVELPNGLFSSAGSSYLPLRFISESLGAKVDWIQQEGKIAITMP
ncbi:stalk domain-containing protein [Cohnella fermenti]|nr:stalk domain-containing protein [Cohnella fermenti]